MTDVKNPRQFWIQRQYEERGTPGNRSHITRDVHAVIPTHLLASMPGVMGEQPGEHRNRRGKDWEDFRSDVAKNGIKNPIFITVDPGQRPKISEGNHRRDAAVELGHKHVPVNIRYFGHAERDSDLESKADEYWQRQQEIKRLG